MSNLTLAFRILTLTAQAIRVWLDGESDEPPALEHLGIPESKLTMLRQRAKAARELKE